MRSLTITRPDDWHLHFRDGEKLSLTVNDTARVFARAIVMPNLQPPVRTAADAEAYRQRINAALVPAANFQPLMTLYLNDKTSAADINAAATDPNIVACKLYPAGATTNSEHGVTDIKKLYPVFDSMQQAGLLLLVHGEITDAHVDIFDREKAFIDSVLDDIRKQFPALRIVLEHITTADAAQFINDAGDNLAATITPQHLLYNRNHMLVGGIRPHLYCLPILKRRQHQEALLKAATSGSPKFFLGTDSAPHEINSKQSACGCAGCYSAHSALELYTQIFDDAGALDKLEAFASFYGADFYGLPRNTDSITLVEESWQVPTNLPFSDKSDSSSDTGEASPQVVPLCAGETLRWRVQSN